MSETVIETNLPTRRRLSERPERMVHREEENPSVTIDASVAPSPSEALADSRRQLQDRDRQLTAERAARAEAERARHAAEQQAAAHAHARSNDRLTAAAAALEAATAEQQAAELAWEAAEEAGDIKQKIAAQKQLSTATFRVASASAEVEQLKQQQPTQPTQTQQQPNPNQPSAAAQRWIAEHPRFTAGQRPDASPEDREYFADAMAAHHAAIAAGYPSNSEAYIEAINQRMDRLYPEDGNTAPPPRRQETNMRDDTAPPSRGSAGRQGWRTAKVNLGENGAIATIEYREEGGGRRVRFGSERDRANFEDGAKTCFPSLWEKNPKEALGEYVNDHIEHIMEGSPDLKIGDGRIYGRGEQE